ncbi:MAG: hypothetical protein M1828_004756 [Chrysothrix sp. TS-e1954]|nr:MAG: hypothetical protein M1828_004756 [Chrysothrix sp. TS-e1954]
MPPPTPPPTPKSLLRARIRSLIPTLPAPSIPRQSLAATKTLLQHPRYRSARRIGIYLSIQGREVDTREIVDRALEEGKGVFVPFIPRERGKDGRGVGMQMLEVGSGEVEGLTRDGWGIPSLDEMGVGGRVNCLGGMGLKGEGGGSGDGDGVGGGGGVGVGLDLLVMPGLAFDVHMRRLGHGRGYYDRFLAGYFERFGCVPSLVALALEEQILPRDQEVETDATDWKVDAIVSGAGEVLVAPPV